MYDAIVIGAGAVGCSIARALSRYNGNFAVLEKCDDVCDGFSKANSAISHAGFEAKPSTNKAKMNILGNKIMPALAEKLGFPYLQNRSLVWLLPRLASHATLFLERKRHTTATLYCSR